jgi:transposase-like protein
MAVQRYTTEQIIKALKETNGMIYLAARRLGCTPQTIYNRANRTQVVKQAIEDSRGEIVDLAEQKLRLAILAGEPWAVALTLKTLGKQRGYVERQEVTGADGGILKIEYVNDWRNQGSAPAAENE